MISRRASVAPMMDWTDRHCRAFHRKLSRHALLYTEMVTAQAVIHGDRERLIGFDPAEHPVALQLGGSDPEHLAEAVRIACDYGYDEINLNVGCPSDRVQSGAFGACLMRDPALVARCVRAMIDASTGPEITVKCRIGVDDQDPEIALRDFVRQASDAGVRSFAIHARKAWLDGLSPKQNRTVPPLDYALPQAIKTETPELEIVLNGGIETIGQARAHLANGFDGVMVGRAAYHDPENMVGAMDSLFDPAHRIDVFEIVRQMADYAEQQAGKGVPLKSITRHMMGLFTGQRGAKLWRRHLSEHAHLPGATPQVLFDALAYVRPLRSSMPDALAQYRVRGWTVFAPDPAMTRWAQACAPVANRLMTDPSLDYWWRCARTWFAGVNVLPNTPSGAVPADGVPPLSGAASDFIAEQLGFGAVTYDAAQISVVTEGYPAQGDEETEAAWRYRVKRCAAHVDGLERIMPERRRKLSETHSFLLGIPLGDASVEHGAFVIWDGSHEIIRAAFQHRFDGIPPADWREQDITDAYTAARNLCFETCEPVELAPGLGSAYVMHPLALHGVAPWRATGGAPRAVAYFRPDAFDGDPVKWLNT